MSKDDWIKINSSDDLPTLKPDLDGGGNPSTTFFSSGEVLVQTKYNELFIAQLSLIKHKNSKDKYKWYSYGTGGRRMAVREKVIAWQLLPELLEV